MNIKAKDINIIIDSSTVLSGDPNRFGFGYVSPSGLADEYVSTMYQNRLNDQLLDDGEIIDELAEGKSYGDSYDTQLEAINSILEFWFIPTLCEMPEYIPQYDSIQEAIKFVEEDSRPYLIYIEKD